MAADKTEVRGLMPSHLAQALDALAIAEGLDRNSYIVKALDVHVKQIGHRTMMLSRMLRGNPYLSEDDGATS